MSDDVARVGGEELQFDRVIAGSPSASPSKLGVLCTACQTRIETEYYDVNGNVCCSRCRAALESAAETPRGIVPFITAGAFGLAAGIAGAAIYYAVMAIAHLEIGLIAILIGYMVGYAVRKGAGRRGGLRFQVLASALTYAAVALAYTPVAVQSAIDARRNAQSAVTTTAGDSHAAAETAAAAARKPRRGLLLALVVLSGLIAALPVLVVIGSFPSGLISGVIIFIGMRQAWRMTGAPWLQILGPYRVGADSASVPA
jgi:hypothetical protein